MMLPWWWRKNQSYASHPPIVLCLWKTRVKGAVLPWTMAVVVWVWLKVNQEHMLLVQEPALDSLFTMGIMLTRSLLPPLLRTTTTIIVVQHSQAWSLREHISIQPPISCTRYVMMVRKLPYGVPYRRLSYRVRMMMLWMLMELVLGSMVVVVVEERLVALMNRRRHLRMQSFLFDWNFQGEKMLWHWHHLASRRHRHPWGGARRRRWVLLVQ